jgi:hypothetical protein
MAQYKIVGSYQIKDVEPSPAAVLAPNPLSSAQVYSFSVSTPEELEELVIANAQAKAAGTSQTAQADVSIVAQFVANEDTL